MFDENEEFQRNRLEEAVATGDILAVRRLIDTISITNDSWRDYDLLKFAVKPRLGEVMKILVDKGFRVNREPENDDDDTPLHRAVMSGHIDLVQILQQAGASQSARNRENETPLHVASRLGHSEITKILLMNLTPEEIASNLADNFGITYLHIACCVDSRSEESKNIVMRFIDARIDLEPQVSANEPKYGGYRPLHFAIENKRVFIVQQLLQANVNVDVKTNDGMTPLHFVAKNGNVMIVDMLLKCDQAHTIDLNIRVNDDASRWPGYTALHFAIDGNEPNFYLQNKTNIVKKLLAHGALVDLTDSSGWSPLHLAAKAGQESMVEILLEHGANVNLQESKVNDDYQGYTPLLIAVEYDFAEIVKLLVKAGATVSVENTKEETPFDLAKRSKKNPTRLRRILLSGLANEIETRPNVNGLTKFHFACIMGYSKIVRSELVRRCLSRTDVNAQVASAESPWGGYTTLHFAVRFDKYEIVDLLLKYNAEVKAKNAKGLTPLHLAVLLKNKMIVTKLLEKQADPNNAISGHPKKIPIRLRRILLSGLENDIETLPNVNGLTKFHFACIMGNSKIVLSELVRRRLSGTDVDEQVASAEGPWGGYTTLHFAVRFDKYEIVDLLLKYNAEVEARNAKGLTPLHLAVLLKNKMIVTKLLEKQADPNNAVSGHPIYNAKTPLHLVSSTPEFGNQIFKLLLDYGADINIEDADGQIPFYNATELVKKTPSLQYIILTWHEYVIKLKIIGFPITEKVETNKKIIDKWRRESESQYLLTSNRYCNLDLIQLCRDEIKKLKNWKIDDCDTLYSILYKSFHGMVTIAYQQNFENILLRSDFKKQFPCYGFLIRQGFIKGMVRNNLLISAFPLMNNIAGMRIPDFCLVTIFYDLTNEDRAAFIAASRN